jgi:hypothetical protein
MTELDQFWSSMIREAEQKAAAQGQNDIVEYLRLKAANDAIRSAGIQWLFTSVTELAAGANRNNAGVQIESIDPHRFARGSSNMAGSAICLRQGVRCLMFEAGWTRTPADGIMRGGVLAAARISHFGMPRFNADLSLAYSRNMPLWHIDGAGGGRRPLQLVDLHDHFLIFLGE